MLIIHSELMAAASPRPVINTRSMWRRRSSSARNHVIKEKRSFAEGSDVRDLVTMRSDLVSVLSEGTLRELTEECAILLSREFPEAQRSEWIEALSREAGAVDECQNDEEAAVKARELVSKLVNATPGVVDGTDREVEGLFNLLMTLTGEYYSEDQATYEKLVRHLFEVVSDTLSPTAAERNVVKYRVLANIFNMLPPSAPLRLDVFIALLSLVSTNGDMDFLQAALQSLPSWLATWDVSVERKNECLAAVAEALQVSECGPEYVDKAYEYELLHLRFISNEPSISQDVRRAAAEKAVANVLRLSKLFQLDELLHIPATLELEGQPMFELLKISVAGTREDYEKWAASVDGQSTLSRLNLDLEALRRKMRLHDLASLCARSVSSEVSYSDIAYVLGTGLEDVESWVIDVIRAGLVSGKLSQVKQSFRVYRSTHRTFEKPQWEALEKRLTQWQKSIDVLLTSLKSMYFLRYILPTDAGPRAANAIEAAVQANEAPANETSA